MLAKALELRRVLASGRCQVLPFLCFERAIALAWNMLLKRVEFVLLRVIIMSLLASDPVLNLASISGAVIDLQADVHSNFPTIWVLLQASRSVAAPVQPRYCVVLVGEGRGRLHAVGVVLAARTGAQETVRGLTGGPSRILVVYLRICGAICVSRVDIISAIDVCLDHCSHCIRWHLDVPPLPVADGVADSGGPPAALSPLDQEVRFCILFQRLVTLEVKRGLQPL